jgi:hypothetical protein
MSFLKKRWIAPLSVGILAGSLGAYLAYKGLQLRENEVQKTPVDLSVPLPPGDVKSAKRILKYGFPGISCSFLSIDDHLILIEFDSYDSQY